MRQESRNCKAKFGPTLVLALVASSMTWAQDVRTNYMPGTDFSKYHTYAWVDEVKGIPRVGGQADQILDTQVKQAVDSQMAAKGFTKVVDGGKPDLQQELPCFFADPEKKGPVCCMANAGLHIPKLNLKHFFKLFAPQVAEDHQFVVQTQIKLCPLDACMTISSEGSDGNGTATI